MAHFKYLLSFIGETSLPLGNEQGFLGIYDGEGLPTIVVYRLSMFMIFLGCQGGGICLKDMHVHGLESAFRNECLVNAITKQFPMVIQYSTSESSALFKSIDAPKLPVMTH